MHLVKEHRSLLRLMRTASTSRVLNLAKRTAAQRTATPAGSTLFAAPALDRCIVVKHRLRPHEREWFVEARTLVTKLLIPIDPQDVGLGAHAIFVGERGFEGTMAMSLGVHEATVAGARDLAVLQALDGLPSLDPFLTREHLRRQGHEAARDYFEISPGDVERMRSFVRREIVPLITLCFGDHAEPEKAARLADRILSSDLDATMEPLRRTLKMEPAEFVEGMFCWKGFLYYKWALDEALSAGLVMIEAISKVRATGDATPEERAYIAEARTRLQSRIKTACRDVRGALNAYDVAFAALTQRAEPAIFRDFLISAPALFFSVGDKLGALQHVTSFWHYKFAGRAIRTPATELCDLLSDFENSLGGGAECGPRRPDPVFLPMELAG